MDWLEMVIACGKRGWLPMTISTTDPKDQTYRIGIVTDLDAYGEVYEARSLEIVFSSN